MARVPLRCWPPVLLLWLLLCMAHPTPPHQGGTLFF
jgi:hypothetical protein